MGKVIYIGDRFKEKNQQKNIETKASELEQSLRRGLMKILKPYIYNKYIKPCPILIEDHTALVIFPEKRNFEGIIEHLAQKLGITRVKYWENASLWIKVKAEQTRHVSS
jgi:hypothetical protein